MNLLTKTTRISQKYIYFLIVVVFFLLCVTCQTTSAAHGKSYNFIDNQVKFRKLSNISATNDKKLQLSVQKNIEKFRKF